MMGQNKKFCYAKNQVNISFKNVHNHKITFIKHDITGRVLGSQMKPKQNTFHISHHC